MLTVPFPMAASNAETLFFPTLEYPLILVEPLFDLQEPFCPFPLVYG